MGSIHEVRKVFIPIHPCLHVKEFTIGIFGAMKDPKEFLHPETSLDIETLQCHRKIPTPTEKKVIFIHPFKLRTRKGESTEKVKER